MTVFLFLSGYIRQTAAAMPVRPLLSMPGDPHMTMVHMEVERHHFNNPQADTPRETHLFMDGWKAYVPDTARNAWYEWFAADVKHKRNHMLSICEVLGASFRMCFDLDYMGDTGTPEERRAAIMRDVRVIQLVMREFFPNAAHQLLFFVCVSAKWKAHIYLPLIIVNSQMALEIRQAGSLPIGRLTHILTPFVYSLVPFAPRTWRRP